MLYLYIKSAHIVALLIWVGTMLVSPWLIAWADHVPPALRGRALKSLRYQYRLLSTTAMIATLAFGITLASVGNWYTMNWLSLKLVLVIVFSGLHGFFSGQLRRLCSDKDYRSPAWISQFCWVELMIITGIVVLVVCKPP